jgi:hypothetical protein
MAHQIFHCRLPDAPTLEIKVCNLKKIESHAQFISLYLATHTSYIGMPSIFSSLKLDKKQFGRIRQKCTNCISAITSEGSTITMQSIPVVEI